MDFNPFERHKFRLTDFFQRSSKTWGLPLSGTCKLVLLLVIAAIVPMRTSLGQTAPAGGKLAESSTAAAETGPCSPCPAEPCDDEPQSGWASSRPFSSLLGRLKADCGQASWANWSAYPLSVGCFAGIVNGGPLIEDWVGTKCGFDGGWRLGWDVNPNWGAETRFAFGSPELYDSYDAKLALLKRDIANGLTFADPGRVAELFQWDVEILYYPCGETSLRPYFLTGMGMTNIYFTDSLGTNEQTTCLSLPLGAGVKYLCREDLAVRVDFLDDIALSSNHLQTQHNLSLTAGVELRFGGSRKIYWPFDPGRSFW